MYEQLYYQEIIKKQKKKGFLFRSAMVGLLVGIVAQAVVDFLINIVNKKPLNQILYIVSPWQIYFTAILAGGINGVLAVLLPKRLFPITAVLVIVALYNGIIAFSDPELFFDNVKNNPKFVAGIVRDIFLIVFIVFILNNIMETKEVDPEENDIEKLLEVTIVSSIVINVSFFLSQRGINSLLNITNDLSSGIAF